MPAGSWILCVKPWKEGRKEKTLCYMLLCFILPTIYFQSALCEVEAMNCV